MGTTTPKTVDYTSYADALLRAWGMDDAPPLLKRSVGTVLDELSPKAQLKLLKGKRRLEVRVVPWNATSVGAYFPTQLKFPQSASETGDKNIAGILDPRV